MLRLDFDLEGLTSQVDKLAEAIQGSIRPAAQAAAQVFYDETRKRAEVSEKGWGTGNLSKAIYQAYASKVSTEDLAVYHITWRKSLNPFGDGKPSARSYGHLIEYGFHQRYKMGRDRSGRFTGPLVREGMKGKKKPGRRAAQSVKDAYWVALPSPIWHPPRSFLRASYDAKKDDAVAAANKEMQEQILKAFP